MKTPILVYGVSGAGASIVIWTIKKILWPDLCTDNPLDSLNTAHNQPLCPHWDGQIQFDKVYSHMLECDRVLHVEPTPLTIPYHTLHPTVMIQLETEQDIDDVAVLCQHKIPNYANQLTEDLKNSFRDSTHLHKKTKGVLNITFNELVYGELNDLISQLYAWCNCVQSDEYQTIVNVHTQWRAGNRLILSK